MERNSCWDRDFRDLRSLCSSAGTFGTPRATGSVMSHRHVEMLIERLATHPGLRRRFEEGPAAVLHELITQGYEFSLIEIDAPTGIDASRFAGSPARSILVFAGSTTTTAQPISGLNQP